MTIIDETPAPVVQLAPEVGHWICCVDSTRTFCGLPNNDPEVIDTVSPEQSGCVVCDDLAVLCYRTSECPITHGPCVNL